MRILLCRQPKPRDLRQLVSAQHNAGRAENGGDTERHQKKGVGSHVSREVTARAVPSAAAPRLQRTRLLWASGTTRRPIHAGNFAAARKVSADTPTCGRPLQLGVQPGFFEQYFADMPAPARHPKCHLGFRFPVEIAAAPPGLPVADLDEALAVPVEALGRSLARDGARNILRDDLGFGVRKDTRLWQGLPTVRGMATTSPIAKTPGNRVSSV